MFSCSFIFIKSIKITFSFIKLKQQYFKHTTGKHNNFKIKKKTNIASYCVQNLLLKYQLQNY